MNNNHNNFEREGWIDFIKTIAIFSVVWLHAAAPWVYRYGIISNFDWQLSNIADSLVRASVPLFFMATGYLFLSKPISIDTYFKRRFNRIIIPWIFWSIIYLIYNSIKNDAHISFLNALLAFANGDIYFHIWFLYTLVGLYLFIPIIHWALQEETQKRSLYFLILWFITASVIPFLHIVIRYLTTKDLSIAIDLSMFGGYSGYLIAGFLIGKYDSTKKQVIIAIGIYIIAVIVTAVATSMSTFHTDRLVEYFYEYLSPITVSASLGAFAVLKSVGMKLSTNPAMASFFKKFSYTSLGIFLVHPIILNSVRDSFLGSYLAISIQALSIPIVAVITFVISFIVIEAMRHIPLFRKTV